MRDKTGKRQGAGALSRQVGTLRGRAEGSPGSVVRAAAFRPIPTVLRYFKKKDGGYGKIPNPKLQSRGEGTQKQNPKVPIPIAHGERDSRTRGLKGWVRTWLVRMRKEGKEQKEPKEHLNSGSGPSSIQGYSRLFKVIQGGILFLESATLRRAQWCVPQIPYAHTTLIPTDSNLFVGVVASSCREMLRRPSQVQIASSPKCSSR